MATAVKQRNPNAVPKGTITPKASTESGLVGANSKYADEAHEHPAHPMCIWRLVANITGADDPVGASGSEWELSDDNELESSLGTVPVSESAGIFSFLSAGIYSIRFYGCVNNGTQADSSAQVTLYASEDNGSNWDDIALTRMGIADAFRPTNGAFEALVRIASITGASACKIKLGFTVGDGNSYLEGGAEDRNISYVVFEKKADLD